MLFCVSYFLCQFFFFCRLMNIWPIWFGSKLKVLTCWITSWIFYLFVFHWPLVGYKSNNLSQKMCWSSLNVHIYESQNDEWFEPNKEFKTEFIFLKFHWHVGNIFCQIIFLSICLHVTYILIKKDKNGRETCKSKQLDTAIEKSWALCQLRPLYHHAVRLLSYKESFSEIF